MAASSIRAIIGQDIKSYQPSISANQTTVKGIQQIQRIAVTEDSSTKTDPLQYSAYKKSQIKRNQLPTENMEHTRTIVSQQQQSPLQTSHSQQNQVLTQDQQKMVCIQKKKKFFFWL